MLRVSSARSYLGGGRRTDPVGPCKVKRAEGGGKKAGGGEEGVGERVKKVQQQSAVATTTAKGSLSCLIRVFGCTHGFEIIL
jgi:hypothetical protein